MCQRYHAIPQVISVARTSNLVLLVPLTPCPHNATPQVISVARTSDLVLMVLDAEKAEVQKKLLVL
jgi:ribosome-interacting GTPase 1